MTFTSGPSLVWFVRWVDAAVIEAWGWIPHLEYGHRQGLTSNAESVG